MLLGIVCNQKPHELDTLQSVSHLYLEAVAGYMQVQPVLIPAPMPDTDFQITPLLDRLDGLLMTGNRTNIHPSHYDVTATPAHEPFDRQRDIVSLALIEAALQRDMPLLAICRGMQELNVVCGGSLATDIQTLDDRLDHRTPPGTNQHALYAARHMAAFPDNGYFHNLLGVTQATTNSLHWQAIDRLGDNLTIEATAEDGTIEAIRHIGMRYCVGVQWHPEYQYGENIISAKLFADFDRAIKQCAA